MVRNGLGFIKAKLLNAGRKDLFGGMGFAKPNFRTATNGLGPRIAPLPTIDSELAHSVVPSLVNHQDITPKGLYPQSPGLRALRATLGISFNQRSYPNGVIHSMVMQ